MATETLREARAAGHERGQRYVDTGVCGHCALARLEERAARKAGRLAESMDELSLLIQYEEGEIVEENFMRLFQRLVDNGRAWTLQGSYGRLAATLIERGYIE